jgi:hypothetical protein
MLADDEFCAFGESLPDKVVAIGIWTLDGDKNIARLDETGIVTQAGRIARTNKRQQFIKIHSVRNILE